MITRLKYNIEHDQPLEGQEIRPLPSVKIGKLPEKDHRVFMRVFR